MGKVVYSTGIQYVKGSLAKPKKQDGHNHGDYLIGTHRTAPTTNPNCTRIYIRKGETYVRTAPLMAKEVAARLRFTAVAAAVKARKADMSKVAGDQAAFIAQRDLPGGKTTMKAYLWKICGDDYDDANEQG